MLKVLTRLDEGAATPDRFAEVAVRSAVDRFNASHKAVYAKSVTLPPGIKSVAQRRVLNGADVVIVLLSDELAYGLAEHGDAGQIGDLLEQALVRLEREA
jgi:hypothetical protein